MSVLKGKSVMVVDDKRLNLKVVKLLLEYYAGRVVPLNPVRPP
jgi:CheY-like chemotaxis protein